MAFEQGALSLTRRFGRSHNGGLGISRSSFYFTAAFCA
jgi:hypothetical protein